MLILIIFYFFKDLSFNYNKNKNYIPVIKGIKNNNYQYINNKTNLNNRINDLNQNYNQKQKEQNQIIINNFNKKQNEIDNNSKHFHPIVNLNSRYLSESGRSN